METVDQRRPTLDVAIAADGALLVVADEALSPLADIAVALAMIAGRPVRVDNNALCGMAQPCIDKIVAAQVGLVYHGEMTKADDAPVWQAPHHLFASADPALSLQAILARLLSDDGRFITVRSASDHSEMSQTTAYCFFRADGVVELCELSSWMSLRQRLHEQDVDGAEGLACVEAVPHGLDLKALRARHADSEASLDDVLEEAFWQTVNPTISDPYLDGTEDWGSDESEWERGSFEALAALVKTFVVTDPDIDSRPAREDDVVIECAWDGADGGEGSGPKLTHWTGFRSERLARLLAIAFEDNYPTGFERTYNDNAADRRSGYSVGPNTVRFLLDEMSEDVGGKFAPSARERAWAMGDLHTWLVFKGRDPAEFGVTCEATRL